MNKLLGPWHTGTRHGELLEERRKKKEQDFATTKCPKTRAPEAPKTRGHKRKSNHPQNRKRDRHTTHEGEKRAEAALAGGSSGDQHAEVIRGFPWQ